jgi:hypothetical protein
MESEDFDLLFRPPEDTRIVVPDGAVDLFPNKLGTKDITLT